MGGAVGKSVGESAGPAIYLGYVCFRNNLTFSAWVLEAHGLFKHRRLLRLVMSFNDVFNPFYFQSGQAFPDEIVMRDTLRAGFRGHEIHVSEEMPSPA